MAAQITLPAPVQQRLRLPAAALVATGLLLVGRVLQFRSGASPDEGGFLLVASQWHAGGSSLYGNYWVDRPPLLIGIFRLADLTGGLFALRIIGALAAAATVALLASTALRVFGRRAATWTAVVGAALLISPLYGAVDVNGELLAIPFVALGIRASVEAVLAEDRAISRAGALVAGVGAIAALLVKQNMADVLVFASVCWVVAWHRRRITRRDLLSMVGFAALGSILTYIVVSLSAMAHGSSPLDVYQATYPFRVAASKVLSASSSTGAGAGDRLNQLGLSFLLSGAPVLLLAFLGRGVRRSRAPGVVWGLIATGAWTAFSVLAGGSYWGHYLVESVPVVALAAGALALQAPRLTQVVVGVVLTSSLVATGAALIQPPAAPGTAIGTALGKAADPGDTVVSLFGQAELVRSAGMQSPYPYLWSLPSETLDPSMTLLNSVLASQNAPTWLVVRGASTVQRLTDHGAMAIIDRRYRAVGELCGTAVYLLRDQDRPVPVATLSCSGGVALP